MKEGIMMKTMITGDRPTGRLHIGHYFGSLKKRVEMQNSKEFDSYILIADVQALTDNFNNPDKVRKNVRELAIDYLSIGIDPLKTTIYIQSMIPEIAELTVYFSNLVTISRLQRNPTVKTEIAQKKDLFGESVTYGFLGYPVSQSADIVALGGEYIPVGDDQLPQIEQCIEIVRKFNSIYGDILKEPQAILSKDKRIKGLDGNEKMGKSLGNAIYLSDSDEEITKKVMKALTDPNRIKKNDKGNPKLCMVAYYHDLFTNKEDVKSELKSILHDINVDGNYQIEFSIYTSGIKCNFEGIKVDVKDTESYSFSLLRLDNENYDLNVNYNGLSVNGKLKYVNSNNTEKINLTLNLGSTNVSVNLDLKKLDNVTIKSISKENSVSYDEISDNESDSIINNTQNNKAFTELINDISNLFEVYDINLFDSYNM